MKFGISTHLYHDQRLGRDHLVEVAEHGFEAIELFATQSHFDYHDASAVGQLAVWLRETGLRLHGIHAPITRSLTGGVWGPSFSTASGDAARREAAVRETDAALNVARRIPVEVLVLHLGMPRGQNVPPGDNVREAALRSIEEILELVSPLGVRLALEVIPNGLSSPAALVQLLEEDLDPSGAGICLDYGHAFLLGDLVDGIETISGHLISTHVHDNDGRNDTHLAPFDGAIDWPSALMATHKVGYEGTFLLELGNIDSPGAVLGRARTVRERFEKILS
jgi:sugar phosphate isomerase/epimerase